MTNIQTTCSNYTVQSILGKDLGAGAALPFKNNFWGTFGEKNINLKNVALFIFHWDWASGFPAEIEKNMGS